MRVVNAPPLVLEPLLAAVAAPIAWLKASHAATGCVAVLESRSFRSPGLLRKLGFERASAEAHARFGARTDELVTMEPDERGV
jgi:hypothetical protein